MPDRASKAKWLLVTGKKEKTRPLPPCLPQLILTLQQPSAAQGLFVSLGIAYLAHGFFNSGSNKLRPGK